MDCGSCAIIDPKRETMKCREVNSAIRTLESNIIRVKSLENNRSVVNHSKSDTAHHCKVLPPGEFNGIIPELLSVRIVKSESFTTIL